MAFLNCSGTFSWGVEATKVKLSSGQVILMAKLKRHNTHGYDDITQTCVNMLLKYQEDFILK